MHKLSYLFAFILISVLTPLEANNKTIIQINEVMDLAEKHSPLVTAAQYQEIAAKKATIIARAGYFPVLNFEAIDSEGFSGSNSWLEVKGLIGSPYRKGLAGGLVAKQTLFDFGRTASDVKISMHEQEYARQNTKITSYEIKQLALETYYQCARYRTLEEIWAQLGHESGAITKEVKRFVKTGQQSVVDNYLSEAQTQEAVTARMYYAESLNGAIHQLSILTGLPDKSFTCPSLIGHKNLVMNDPESPFITRAKADLKVAQAKLERQKSELLPKIVTMASLGHMESTHLVSKKDYSIGIGFIMPLYDLRTIGEIKKANAIVAAKNHDVRAQMQFIDEMNAKFDTIIKASQIRLQYLTKELELANKGFKLAKKRYSSMEGELIDSREAFRNLARTQVEIEETRANLLATKGSKALLNGAGI